MFELSDFLLFEFDLLLLQGFVLLLKLLHCLFVLFYTLSPFFLLLFYFLIETVNLLRQVLVLGLYRFKLALLFGNKLIFLL